MLYADDTVLLGKNHEEVQRVSHKIEETSKQYGVTLNREKCVHPRINNNSRVAFNNNMKMPTEEDQK